jgi:hypothetical protein
MDILYWDMGPKESCILNEDFGVGASIFEEFLEVTQIRKIAFNEECKIQ